jgi:trk system potassium uptake protein TrkH
MALAFLAVILLGTLLLALPAANASGRPRDLVTALFTATSATCVTGLSVIDIGAELTRFGQLVLLALMQVGGIGITLCGTFLLVLAGRRLSVQSEFVLMDAYGVGAVKGISALLVWTMGFTVLFEGLGTLLLWASDPLPDRGAALFHALFHAVSAFCNAGFSLHADSLTAHRSAPLYLAVIDGLVIAGGLGFLVLYNLVTIKFWRRNRMTRGRVTLHSRTVLTATAALLVLGALLFLLLEWSNTLAGLPLTDKLSTALLQGVTARTAGFNVIPMGSLQESTLFTLDLLMLIGGSPGSAAGGIKTTTLVVLAMTVIAICKNRRETVLFNRTVPIAIVREAVVILLLALALVALAYGALLVTEAPVRPGDTSRLLFEAVSALATVGLSVDHTSALSTAGRCVIIICMYVGRLGPLTAALLIGTRAESGLSRIRYPEEELVVG